MSFYHTIKSFKGISFIRFLKYVIIIDILLILYVKFIPNNYIKDQEKKLSTYDIIKIYVNRFIHYIGTTIVVFYPVIVNNTIFTDVIYILYESIVITLFHLNGGCILSKHENKLLNYANMDPHNQPFYMVFANNENDHSHTLSKVILFILHILLLYVASRTIYHLLHKK